MCHGLPFWIRVAVTSRREADTHSLHHFIYGQPKLPSPPYGKCHLKSIQIGLSSPLLLFGGVIVIMIYYINSSASGDTNPPLKTYFRRKYQQKNKELNFGQTTATAVV